MWGTVVTLNWRARPRQGLYRLVEVMYEVGIERLRVVWGSKNSEKREDVKIEFERGEKEAVDVRGS